MGKPVARATPSPPCSRRGASRAYLCLLMPLPGIGRAKAVPRTTRCPARKPRSKTVAEEGRNKGGAHRLALGFLYKAAAGTGTMGNLMRRGRQGRARGRERGEGKGETEGGRQPKGYKGHFLRLESSEVFCAGDPTKRAWGCSLGLCGSGCRSGSTLWRRSASSHPRWPVG